jgi:kynurenine formamidase
MPRRFVDLSIFLENDVLSDPPAFAPKIQYLTHDTTVEQIASFFPGLTREDLPDGEGWAVEFVQLSTHNGTHLDAPYHFHSTMDKALGDKKPAIAIHDVPLEWCFQPGVKLDFRHFADGYVVTAADVEAELARIGHTLKPLEIVVVNTRAGSRYGHPDYVASGCGMGYEATMYLLERGIRLTGTDAWSWDAPFVHTAVKCSPPAARRKSRRRTAPPRRPAPAPPRSTWSAPTPPTRRSRARTRRARSSASTSRWCRPSPPRPASR